jgi:hypothetical protein
MMLLAYAAQEKAQADHASAGLVELCGWLSLFAPIGSIVAGAGLPDEFLDFCT